MDGQRYARINAIGVSIMGMANDCVTHHKHLGGQPVVNYRDLWDEPLAWGGVGRSLIWLALLCLSAQTFLAGTYYTAVEASSLYPSSAHMSTHQRKRQMKMPQIERGMFFSSRKFVARRIFSLSGGAAGGDEDVGNSDIEMLDESDSSSKPTSRFLGPGTTSISSIEKADSPENSIDCVSREITEQVMTEQNDYPMHEETSTKIEMTEKISEETGTESITYKQIDCLSDVIRSDVIRNLISARRSSSETVESMELRKLMSSRREEYFQTLLEYTSSDNGDLGKNSLPQHPTKLLHFLAPKIPAIKHSPNYNLRIRSARADVDSGLAACAIFTLASVTEIYDKRVCLNDCGDREGRDSAKELHEGASDEQVSSMSVVVSDRRFEQLVECVLCGVNVKNRLKEAKSLDRAAASAATTCHKEKGDGIGNGSTSPNATEEKRTKEETDETHPSSADSDEIEDKNDLSNVEESGEKKVEKLYKHEGISVSDACRAAWGLAVLGAHNLPKIGGERPTDILLALSLRTRDLLLARFHRLQHSAETVDSGDVNFDPDGIDPRQSFEDEVAELMEDVAAAMWAFAFVKACTGLQSDYLLSVCCSILSIRKHNLIAPSERGQEDVEMDDIVDKLVRSEKESISSSVKVGGSAISQEEIMAETSQSTGDRVATALVSDSSTHLHHQRHLVLLDSLSSKDLVNVVWALAMHTCVEGTVRSEVSSLTDEAVALRGVASRRILELLHSNVIGAVAQAGTPDHEQGNGGTEHNFKDSEGSPSPIKPNGSTSSDIDESDGGSRGSTYNPEAHQLVGCVEVDPAAASQSNAERPAGSQQPNDNELDPVAATVDASQSNAERRAGSQQPNDIEQVEVVDAASLLGSADTGVVNVETETLIAPATGATEDNTAHAHESSEIISSLEGGEVEVIDAASLLEDTGMAIPVSSEVLKPRPGTNTENSIQERKNVSTECPKSRDSEEIEVADADSILASETGAHFVNTQVMSEDVPVDESTNVLPTSVDDGSFIHAKDSSTDGKTVGRTNMPDRNSFAVDANLSFSIHDLCLVAWAFTELRDPHRGEIIVLVQQLLLNADFFALASLEPRDLSNLAWALARFAEASKQKPSALSCSYMLTQQIIELAQAKRQNFEPTELSRLMWSLATVASRSRHSSHNAENDRGTNSLVEFALETAGADCNAVSGRAFSTEDLARIAWAFLELCGKTVHSSFPLKTSKTLGRIQSTIEAALLRWESGQYSQPSKPVCESTRLTPLFGKSRSLISFLDQVDINDSTAVHSGDDSHSSAKSHLPALRDLPVDPATLCKLVYGYSRLPVDHADISGVRILLRVAVRLLSSKNGQLLKECKPEDIVRLCYACATLVAERGCDISSEDRDIVLRQFPRRVVELINQSSHEAGTSFLDLFGTPDLSALLWSLGELGVQTGTERDDNRFAHRKLHLTAKKPLLSSDELKDLPSSSLVELFCGVVALGVMEDVGLLNKILLQFQSKDMSLSPHECCQIATALAKIRRRVGLYFVRTDPNYELEEDNSNGADKVGDSEKIQRPLSKSEDEDKLVSALEENEAAAEIVIENLLHEGVSNDLLNSLLISCNQVLTLLANFAFTNISDFSAGEIRQLLETYAIIPFDSDMLVDSVEIEVNKRCASLEVAAAMPDGASVQMLIRRAADSAVEAATCIPRLTRDDDKAPNLLKNGIKALFEKQSSMEGDKDPGSELASSLIGASEMINRAAASACEAAARIERVDRGALVNSESILRGSEEEASFELGRCQALIANYRQTKFKAPVKEKK